MKLSLLLNLLLVVVSGCDWIGSEDKVQEFVPGTYIRFSQHEFGIEYDTLVLSLLNGEAGEYQVERKWRYERVLDGEKLEPEYKSTFNTGFYDKDYHILHENESGNVYSFNLKEKALFIGNLKYLKL